MFRTPSKIFNQKGMTLLELLTAIGLISLIAAGIAGMNHFVLRSAKQLDQTSMALGLRNTFVTEIENGAAWQKTLEKNPEMACLLNQTVCTDTNPIAFDLYNEKGELFYNAKSPTSGFTSSRATCNDFPNKNTSCIFHFDLTWQAMCPVAGDCSNPLVLVSAILKLDDQGSKDGTLVMLDKNYSVQVFKSYAKTSIEANCLAVGGTFDVVTKNCVTKLTDKRCPAGLFLAGVSGNGNLKCVPAFKADCDVGEVLSGIGPTGKPICTNKVAQFAPTAPAAPATKPDAGTGPAAKSPPTPPGPSPAKPKSACAASFGGKVVDMTATVDEDINGMSGNLNVTASRRIMNISGVSGNLRVQSVIEVPKVKGISGNAWINASYVGVLTGVSGNLCLNAVEVGSFEGGSGDTEIFSQTLDYASSQSGNLIIHRALVQKLSKVSGNICLMDGAKILDISDISGDVTYGCK